MRKGGGGAGGGKGGGRESPIGSVRRKKKRPSPNLNDVIASNQDATPQETPQSGQNKTKANQSFALVAMQFKGRK